MPAEKNVSFPIPKHRSEFKTSMFGRRRKKNNKADKNTTRFREAMEMLKSMSVDEIKEARSELNSLLSQESIAFLKRRGTQKLEKRRLYDHRDNVSASTSTFIDNTIDKVDMCKLVTDQDLLNAAKNSKGIEREKLAWIVGEKDDENNESNNNDDDAIRIDLSGNVVDADYDPEQRQGLHHHGKSPEKAGYTVRELITLGSSAFPAQKSTALKALASYFDINKSLLPCTYDANLIRTICASLISDRKNRTIWSTTIFLMRTLGTSLMKSTQQNEEKKDSCFETICGRRLGSRSKNISEILNSVSEFGFLKICAQVLKTKEEKSSALPLILSCSRESLSVASLCYEILTPMYVDVLKCPLLFLQDAPLVFELVRTLCEAGEDLAKRICLDGVLDIMLRTLALRVVKADELEVLKTESLRAWRVCLQYGNISIVETYFETLFPCLTNTLLSKSLESKRVRVGSLLILEMFCRKIKSEEGRDSSLGRSIVSLATVLITENRDLDIVSCSLHVLASYVETHNCEEDSHSSRVMIKQCVKNYLKRSEIWQNDVMKTSNFVCRRVLSNVLGVIRNLICVMDGNDEEEDHDLLMSIWKLIMKRGWKDRELSSKMPKGRKKESSTELAHITCVVLDVLRKKSSNLLTCIEAARISSIVLPHLRRGEKSYVKSSEGSQVVECRFIGDETYAFELFSKYIAHPEFLQTLIPSFIKMDKLHKHDFCMSLRDILIRRATRLICGDEKTLKIARKFRTSPWPNLEFDRNVTETKLRFGLLENKTTFDDEFVVPKTWCLELLLEFQTSSAAKVDMSMNQGVAPRVARRGSGAAIVWLYSLENITNLQILLPKDLGVR